MGQERRMSIYVIGNARLLGQLQRPVREQGLLCDARWCEGGGVRACALITKPSLAMRPTGLMEHRVKARDSGPSVTLEIVYSVSSTCTMFCRSKIES